MHVLDVGGENIPTFDPHDWGEIERSIRSLDGDRRPYLMLSGPKEAQFGIMATKDSRFYCTFFPGEGDTTVLVSPDVPDDDDDDDENVVDVYLNRVSPRMLVNLETALRAARSYAERGVLDPSLSWEVM